MRSKLHRVCNFNILHAVYFIRTLFFLLARAKQCRDIVKICKCYNVISCYRGGVLCRFAHILLHIICFIVQNRSQIWQRILPITSTVKLGRRHESNCAKWVRRNFIHSHAKRETFLKKKSAQ